MKTCPPEQNNKLKQVRPNGCASRSMVSSLNIRIIEQEPIIFNRLGLFNQQILGPELSKSLHWQPLLSIKTKYLFSKELHFELLNLFKQIELIFYQKKRKRLTSGERILISCMRTLASWDIDVSILVVDVCMAFLDTKMRSLFLQCLNELSVRVPVFIIAHDAANGSGTVETNKTAINEYRRTHEI